MVLHFEEGGSFKAWLKGLKRAPRQTELETILAPLLDALEMVHDGDFLHRDIAPDNIIIRKDGDAGADRLRLGARRDRLALQDRQRAGQAGLQPLRAVRHEQHASRGRGPTSTRWAPRSITRSTGKRPPDAPSRMVNDEYVPAREAALSSYRTGFPRRSTRR